MTDSSSSPILEVCVETIQQGLLAENNHADRIEFCHRLDLGGVTPDHDLIRSAVNTILNLFNSHKFPDDGQNCTIK